MNRDDAWTLVQGLLVATAIVVLATSAHADEPKLPAGYTCEDVRSIVSEVGKIKALAMAFEAGATWRQVNEARKCLRAK